MVGHVLTLHEDALDFAVSIFEWLVDEVEDPAFHLLSVAAAQLDLELAAMVSLAAVVGAVEQLVDALPVDLGQCLPDRLAQDRTVLDQHQVGIVGEFEYVFRTGQDCHEAGRLPEQGVEEFHVAGQAAVGLFQRHALGVEVAVDPLQMGFMAGPLLRAPYAPGRSCTVASTPRTTPCSPTAGP